MTWAASIVVNLAMGIFAGELQAPGAGQASGTIAGTVVTDDASAVPVRRAIVTVSGNSLPEDRSTVTDDEGRFTFAGLPAGRFTITASRPTFVTSAHGATRPGRPGVPIAVAAGQTVTGATIRMMRGAVIAGALRQPTGEPAAGIRVSVLRVEPDDGREPVGASPAVSGEADDRGSYRLFGLPPGEYIVVAQPSSLVAERPSSAEIDRELQRLAERTTPARGMTGVAPVPSEAPGDRDARPFRLTPIFYPGTPVSGRAQRITLAPGQERSGVDFAIDFVPTFQVEGMAASADGWLPASAQVQLRGLGPRDSVASPTVTGAIDSQGRFTFRGVPPGHYVLTGRAASNSPGQPSLRTAPLSFDLWAMRELAVTADVAGVVLTFGPPPVLAGRVVFEGGPPPANLRNIRVVLEPQDRVTRALAGVWSYSLIAAAGTFEVRGVPPGRYLLRVSLPVDVARLWSPVSAVQEGRDLLDLPMDIGGGGDLRGVVVTLTDRPAELAGSLMTADGRAAEGYGIVVLSAERRFWFSGSRRVQLARAGSDGSFVIRGLPPGDYLVAALTDVDASDLADARFLEEITTAAVKIAIAAGERTTQDLRIK
jgi:hypothetical protein